MTPVASRQLRRWIVRHADIHGIIGSVIPLTIKDYRARGLCPFHENKHKGGDLSVYRFRVGGNVTCFDASCKIQGDVVDFMARYMKITEEEAMGLIMVRTGCKLFAPLDLGPVLKLVT